MINVIVVRNQVVNDNFSFTDAKKAEKFFIDKVSELSGKEISGIDERTVLEEGYFELYDGSVCLTWATVVD